MGIAVAGMHYSAMYGVTFRADSGYLPTEAGAGHNVLAVAVTASTFLILTLALGAAIFDRRFTMLAGREARMRLRLHLADVMRDADSNDALREASRLMGEHCGVVRAGYGHLDAEADEFDYRACWTDGRVPPLLGRLPAHAFGVKIVAELNAGRTIVIDDLMTSPLSDEAETHATASAVDTRAILVVPFRRGGRLRTIFYLNDRDPRVWSADEVAFMEELAENTRQIVARVEAEAELRQLNETLEARVAERTAELQQTEAALRQSQKMEAIGQLTGGIAHDFNNMLTGVIGNLDLFRRRMKDAAPETLERYVDAAGEAARRAAALTARLLAYSRRQQLDSRPIDVGGLVRSLDDLLRTSVGETITLRFDLPDAPVAALADPHQLESAIVNLAINARDAMPDGGDLLIAARAATFDTERAAALDLAPGDYVMVTVQDSGTGMPQDTAERAFEPFFTTKPVGQGTGLGLSMVYGFARQSGGQAQIASYPGEGTSVTMILPRAAAAQNRAETAPKAAVHGAGQAILLVEDDEAVRPLVAELLRELGYRPIAVGDAGEAMAIVDSAEPIDLMVSDIGLPGMNGRDLADLARRHRPDMPVLFVTGYAERAAHQGVSLDPGMGMITKPFEFETLAIKIGELLAVATPD
jgi:signal transduction histidine kinase